MEAESGTDSVRRTGAILVILLGGAALWWMGGRGADVTASKGALYESTVAEQAPAGANDPRLKGAQRFEDRASPPHRIRSAFCFHQPS